MCTGPETVVPAALRGYRTWRITRDGQLRSTAFDYVWPTAGERKAECRRGPTARVVPVPGMPGIARLEDVEDHRDEAPGEDCKCGFYGWYDPADARMVDAPVFGAIEVAGRVKVGGHGFRAERARLVALVVTPEMRTRVGAAELLRRLEVDEVPVYEDRPSLLADFPPDDVSHLVKHECDPACMEEILYLTMAGRVSGFLTAHYNHAHVALTPAPEPPPAAWKRWGALLACAFFLLLTLYSSVALPWGAVTKDDGWAMDALRAVLWPINVWGVWLWSRHLRRAWRWGR